MNSVSNKFGVKPSINVGKNNLVNDVQNYAFSREMGYLQDFIKIAKSKGSSPDEISKILMTSIDESNASNEVKERLRTMIKSELNIQDTGESTLSTEVNKQKDEFFTKLSELAKQQQELKTKKAAPKKTAPEAAPTRNIAAFARNTNAVQNLETSVNNTSDKLSTAKTSEDCKQISLALANLWSKTNVCEHCLTVNEINTFVDEFLISLNKSKNDIIATIEEAKAKLDKKMAEIKAETAKSFDRIGKFIDEVFGGNKYKVANDLPLTDAEKANAAINKARVIANAAAKKQS